MTKRMSVAVVAAAATLLACNVGKNNPRCAEESGCIDEFDVAFDNNANDAGNNTTTSNAGNNTPNDDCRVQNFCTDAEVCNSATGLCVECITNNECGSNAVCNADTNTCECNTGFHKCANECVNSSSVDHCGTSCTACPTDPNGTATCDGTTCAIDCDQGLSFDAATNSCVQCDANADCTDADASKCDANNACVGCEASGDCSHLTGTPLCDVPNGTCVECTATNDSACSGNSCDSATGTCTQTAKESVAACEPCVADSECMVDHACVPMEFDGTARTGGFCLPVEPSAGCDGLYGTSVNRTSLSGVTDDYCTINEAATTCEALDDYGKSCSDDSDCGVTGLDDGACIVQLDFEPGAGCSVPCTTSAECPDASQVACSIGGPHCGEV